MDDKYLIKNNRPKSEMYFFERLKEMEKMPDSIKESIFGQLSLIIDEKIRLINECQTPIEFLLATEIENQLEHLNETGNIYHQITPQAILDIDSNTSYKVDLLLTSRFYGGYDDDFPSIVIECDGHDFHEKTKEQAAADKKRDRKLQLAGYHVIRFTGSEIYNRAHFCSREVICLLKKLIYENE